MCEPCLEKNNARAKEWRANHAATVADCEN
jgi:hypothetical protein